jgi:polyisoprenoid-binding protein YceI
MSQSFDVCHLLIKITFISSLLLLTSCEKKTAETTHETATEILLVDEIDTLSIDIQKSLLTWIMESPTGNINGIIPMQSGELYRSKNVWLAGNISLTMSATEVKSPAKKSKPTTGTEDLKSADFFWTDSFPVASIQLIGFRMIDSSNVDVKNSFVVPSPTIIADAKLTIKGIEQSIEIPLSLETSATMPHLTGHFIVQRVDFGLAFPDEIKAEATNSKGTLYHSIDFGIFLYIKPN